MCVCIYIDIVDIFYVFASFHIQIQCTFRGTVPFWLISNNILCILNSPKAVNQKNLSVTDS